MTSANQLTARGRPSRNQVRSPHFKAPNIFKQVTLYWSGENHKFFINYSNCLSYRKPPTQSTCPQYDSLLSSEPAWRSRLHLASRQFAPSQLRPHATRDLSMRQRRHWKKPTEPFLMQRSRASTPEVCFQSDLIDLYDFDTVCRDWC